MRFATITAIFAAGALAAPTPQTEAPATSETIEISNFSVRRTSETNLTNVNFNINGGDAANLVCSLDNPVLPYSTVTKCGDSSYSFSLVKGEKTDYGIRLYKALGGPAVGFYGEGDVFTYCHAGGLGDLLCTQQAPASVVIDSA